MYFAFSVALVFALSATTVHISDAEAASKSYNKSKVSKSPQKRASRRRSTGGGGCQSLSSSSLEQKASQYNDSISSASSKYGVNKGLIKAVITIESCFKSTARGSLGEKGLMQLMPGTARRFNIRNGYNAWENVHGGTRYLSYLLARYDGDARRAVAAYNAGEGRIKQGGRIPNKAYVNKVMQAYGKFGAGSAPEFVAAKAYQLDASSSVPDSQPVKPQLVQPMKAVFTQPAKKVKSVTAVTKASYTANKPKTVKRGRAASVGALPWADMNTHAAGKGSAVYRVRGGDTVYEVMRQTGVPVKTIIRLNRLPTPYHVQAGQTLRLR